MIDSVTTVINNTHKNKNSTFGEPRNNPEFGFPLVPPVQFSAAYSFNSGESLQNYHKNKYLGNRYCRDANDGCLQLEKYFEAMFPMTKSLMYASGMAAMAAALDILLPEIRTVFIAQESYRKTNAYLQRIQNLFKFKIDFFSTTKELEEKLSQSEQSLVIIETPTNPHLYLADLSTIVELQNRYKLRTIIDISLAGLCNIDFDFSQFDCTLISCTKYVSGHNDVLAGVLLTGKTNLFNDLWALRSERGGLLDSFSSYLLLRSLRTYDLRIGRQVKTTKYILEYLDQQKKVNKIYHPSFNTGEQAEIFNRYYRHGGSVISFIVDIDVNLALESIGSLHSIKMAPSFGSVDSLIEIPSVMSHYGKSNDELKAIGLEPNLVRLSIGCEPVDDLIKDIDSFLNCDTSL